MELTSRDGTRIAFDRAGQGPPLILVDGALCYRASGPSGPLAAALTPDFTVYIYDRRGRGESTDTPPYTVEREVEDIAALIEHAGGKVFLYGISSGAALALEAAHRGLAISKLALYEAPFMVDDTRPPLPDDYVDRLKDCIAAKRPGDAVKMFMKTVGVPGIGIAFMRLMPVWSKLKGVAHTLPYDITITRPNQRGKPLSAAQWLGVKMPTLVLDGGKSPVWMRNAMKALATALPHASLETLDRQTHMVSPKALAPALKEFFLS